ncbi:MAG: hypothetical protein BWY52_03337 [Chloroflexi bacterium ADurb.Bin325]|nr:MAG: hypothetical protein BWY52_03337 [Chloroflexi bacterium ADurb.Bin325]
MVRREPGPLAGRGSRRAGARLRGRADDAGRDALSLSPSTGGGGGLRRRRRHRVPHPPGRQLGDAGRRGDDGHRAAADRRGRAGADGRRLAAGAAAGQPDRAAGDPCPVRAARRAGAGRARVPRICARPLSRGGQAARARHLQHLVRRLRDAGCGAAAPPACRGARGRLRGLRDRRGLVRRERRQLGAPGGRLAREAGARVPRAHGGVRRRGARGRAGLRAVDGAGAQPRLRARGPRAPRMVPPRRGRLHVPRPDAAGRL